MAHNLRIDATEDPRKLRKRMTASPTRRSHASRAGATYPLLPRGQATPETLLYLAGCAMLIVAVLLALFSGKPRYSSATEPVVVWRSDEPGILRDALQTPMLEHLKVDFHEAQAASISARGIPCTELAQSWFRPVANQIAGSVAARQGVPLACDWTPGEPEVVIIDR